MSKLFYLTSSHSWCGSTVMFHAKNGAGYVTSLDDAHLFTKEDAQSRITSGHLRNGNNEELPLWSLRVDALATVRVDCQYVNQEWPEFNDEDDQYVVYKKNCWDGNDLGFSTMLGYSFDYTKAHVFSEKELQVLNTEGWVAVPKSHADSICRRTFQAANINKRKMITSGGLIGYRSPKVSKSSGKERWNCPVCGKISWQYHPYEFEGCNDINCQEWTSQYDRYRP